MVSKRYRYLFVKYVFEKYKYMQHSPTEFVLLFHSIDDDKGQEVLHDLVQFWMGYPSLPTERTTAMHVKYLANSAN